jgi:integrative and conjugative element protein (TIGR02256 family)
MKAEYLWAMKEFRNDEIEVRVILEDKAYSCLEEIVNSSGCFETGGILIGYYDVSCQNAIITEITNAPKDSKSGGNWFSRGISGLKQLLIHRWKAKEEYYLGEWHLHPKSFPKPSSVDVSQMKQISKDKRYNCKEPLLLIVGENKRKLEINLMLIMNDKIYEFKKNNLQL